MINAQQKRAGFGKDIIYLCLQRQGHQVKYHELPIKRTHHFMEMGEVDDCLRDIKQTVNLKQF